jgi:membrane protease YdiL (CAAX protease family)
MKRLMFCVLWLAGFLALGYAIGLHFHAALMNDPGLRTDLPANFATNFVYTHPKLACAVVGIVLFALAYWLGMLSGTRRLSPWGPLRAVHLVIGFLVLQLAGATICAFFIQLIVTIASHLRHIPAPDAGINGTLAGVFAGYLTATLWSIWYIGRLGPARLHDGSPTGIAWRPAPRKAYAAAALFAIAIIIVVMIIVHIIPPNLDALKNNPTAKLFGAPGLPAITLLVLAVLIAPPVEEFVFRGGIFSALASRCSPLWAGIITTILFMAVHAPEKYLYPAGFIDVGLMAAAAAWMRVRFNSIRPGILLHILYNAGLMLAAGVAS